MKELNATQQAIIMSFFDPFVDVIVDSRPLECAFTPNNQHINI
ncbi:hypothetical protein [Bacteroides xylanisolvens]|nr:hypothetical protein [Bacteroides xylanisolvens]